MLTSLKVSGFKNLVDVDVKFGPLTCIAGANGVGKSNLFDAIKFLGLLAEKPMIEAASSIRDEDSKSSDIRSIFHRVGDEYDNKMSFEAEMIIPGEGIDELGQSASATTTFLRYTIWIGYKKEESIKPMGSLELLREELVHINQSDAKKHLLFDHKASWRKSAVKGRRTTSYYISTEDEGNSCLIKIHQDKTKGRPFTRNASQLPRTVLSIANTAEYQTVMLARNEMLSWKLLQLEPSSLRQPDRYDSPSKLRTNGANLPATLYRLAGEYYDMDIKNNKESQIYSQIANRLSELIDDVYEITVDKDDKRELLTLMVTGKDETPHAARSLSDGTLRFLALSVLELDPEAKGVICLEEPENGIHPKRIPAMINLLKEIATDENEPVSEDNPLRQVIINTHSPAVVGEIPDKCLIIAELKEKIRDKKRIKGVSFSCLPNTWRAKSSDNKYTVSIGKLLSYLNPHSLNNMSKNKKTLRVIDRQDINQLLIPFRKEITS